MAPTVYARALERAAEILGSKEALRERLRVPMRELERWLSGEAEPPTTVFLGAVDIVSGESDLIERARKRRERASATRATAIGTLARAKAIQDAILAGKRSPRPRPRSVLGFLEAKFEPADGADMIEAALECAISETEAQKGNVQLLCENGLRIVAQRGFERPFVDFFATVTHEGCACGVAMRSGKRVVIADVAGDPLFAGTAAGAVMLQAGARAVQSTPLMASSGWLLGMLSTHYEHPYEPRARELEAIDRVARQAAYWLEGGR